MKTLLENKLMVLTVLVALVGIVVMMTLFVGLGYEMYLDSLTLDERVDLLKNGDMTLNDKLNLFR